MVTDLDPPDIGTAGRRRHPPSANEILESLGSGIGLRDRNAVLDVLRGLLEEERARIRTGESAASAVELADALRQRLAQLPGLGPTHVVNATGVILHTNLGRAPWPEAAILAATQAAGRFVFLELDRETGRRAPRFDLAEAHLAALTGAEAALCVNNNAAALALSLAIVGRGRGVAVARGELAEIGGGVRIPELIRRAGVRLVEVGTTNRTRVADFESALETGARGILRVHASNYRVEGFTERPSLGGLVEVARRHGVPVIEDLGSGALLETRQFGLAHEPSPAESVAAGVDLVTFSGDKLLGGPQSGLIVGRAEMIARLRRDPLARALRLDKVMLAALAATLGLYRSGEAAEKVPVWRMLAARLPDLRRRARAIAAAVLAATGHDVEIVKADSTVGGGSLPGQTLASIALALRLPGPERAHRHLRTGDPAVIGRVQGGAVLLDLRAVLPEEDDLVVSAIIRLLEELP
jgi:L-seryl-tRNA(Ser) seleniumtransferase